MSSTATISLAAIRHNLGVAAALAPGCAVLLAIKANAYGHGAVEVAQMVEATAAAAWLGVAEVAEGEQVRAAGVRLPILKFSNCAPEQWAAAIAADLTLTVTDTDSITRAAAAAADVGRVARVHLKVDTGMGRIGLGPQASLDLVRAIDVTPHLELDGIFTHLASADAEDDAGFTAGQQQAFDQVVETVQSSRGAVRWVHSSNSGGVLFHSQTRRTMVRPGIMAYGYQPDRSHSPTEATRQLRPALSWRSVLSFVKHVLAGTPISYGSTWHAPRDTWIGTVPVGYGDGYPRAHSSLPGQTRGTMLVGGLPRDVVGRVCMDQTMIDLGPDGSGFSAGDEVVLLGSQQGQLLTADDLAEQTGTISYEVLCRIGSRVQRLHSDETAIDPRTGREEQ